MLVISIYLKTQQTYTGTVLVAVNPYENLYIYSKNLINMYKQKKITELPPHIFAIANIAYNKLIEENRNQCILVSGESGKNSECNHDFKFDSMVTFSIISFKKVIDSKLFESLKKSIILWLPVSPRKSI